MHINAGWERKSENKAICRWFVAWSEIKGMEYSGAIAGYSGGGAFIVERFYAKTDSTGQLTKLWIDFTDHLSGDEIEFDDCGENALTISESCLDCVWDWNDNDIWNDTDQVVLRNDKQSLIKADDDLLLFSDNQAPFLKKICEYAGLTAAPKD